VVSQRITVTFPRWTPPPAVAPTLIAHWAAYTQDLAAHEQGHVDFVVDHVPAIVAAIKEATCATASAAAQRAADVIHQHDRAYDAATQHGVTQGALFP
jgi:predicted secreted Zn-dependent protease